ncbi:hypothetical protein [Acinetobacter sp. MB5]|uniref:hypothetical protein n=1 Tax=Acinetobacter sp. MB5 TaxID=2069438 RepID=UPI0013A6F749|nr:hypothetical protein [Acinetobacter sp. MB5]
MGIQEGRTLHQAGIARHGSKRAMTQSRSGSTTKSLLQPMRMDYRLILKSLE